jgi:Fe-S cluster assembly protein SufD
LAERRAAAVEPEWLSERRRKGASSASELPLPGHKDKGWEFTDLEGLDLDAFAATKAATASLNGGDGGRGGPFVMPLRDAVERVPETVAPSLGSLVGFDDPFAARNEAGWRDGVLVYVPRGERLNAPVELSAIAADAGAVFNWRALVVLEEGAEAEVWESYGSPEGREPGVFNGVVELIVGDGANLRYVCEQRLADRDWVFATQRADVGRDASLEWIALGFGSARGKVRMETKLSGRGSSARVTGAYVGRGSQHLDFDTTQEHAAESTFSDLAFRGVLGDRATAVWRGMIKVDEGAQRTDAFQESRNLLLSPSSHADSIPGLEIEADDVRCTHAAAVAQVDPEQLYYLRARGIREPEAKRVVVEGFLQELVERAPEGRARELLSSALEERLSELLADA